MGCRVVSTCGVISRVYNNTRTPDVHVQQHPHAGRKRTTTHARRTYTHNNTPTLDVHVRCLCKTTTRPVIPANTQCWPNVGLMLNQRLRCWSNNNLTSGQRLVFVREAVLSCHLGVICKQSPCKTRYELTSAWWGEVQRSTSAASLIRYRRTRHWFQNRSRTRGVGTRLLLLIGCRLSMTDH